MKPVLAIAVVLTFAGCTPSKEAMRQEMRESASFVERSCPAGGAGSECRYRLTAMELQRIQHTEEQNRARRESVAGALQQHFANQQALAQQRQQALIEPQKTGPLICKPNPYQPGTTRCEQGY